MAKRVILTILDGWGIAPAGPGNAITLAHPETYNYLVENYPNSVLEASGIGVGLPANQDGNTETGHLNIGAGRIVYQDLARINMSIADGSFFTNQTLLDTANHVKNHRSNLHLLGLIGASGVHAFNEHLYALIMFASIQKIQNLYLHLFTDGRDSPQTDALNQISKVKENLDRYKIGQIVSLSGRYYSMDRDQRLDRTKLALECIVKASGENYPDSQSAISKNYQQNLTDEFILPCTIGNNPNATRIQAGDAVVFFNFRIDRSRQLTQMLKNSDISDLRLVTMTKYHDDFNLPIIFPDNPIVDTLGEVISKSNLKQLRAAESEKERFVTYYFNGLKEDPFVGEKRLIIPSPKIATYDLKPQMSTSELIKSFSQEWLVDNYSFGVINIACPDMVAHTGKVEPTIAAIKAADQAIKELLNLCKDTSSDLLITGDHGNAEELLLANQDVDTKHSNFPVPLILYTNVSRSFKLENGVLGDIAPTILELLEISKPSSMTGQSLIVRQA